MIPLEAYGFHLPEDLIAQYPADPPEMSKLLYVPRGQSCQHHRSIDLVNLLPPRSLLVANDTKVIPARLKGCRLTGGQLEILLSHPEKNNLWWALVKGKLQEGETCQISEAQVTCERKEADGLCLLRFHHPNVSDFAQAEGEIPLPPYIKRPVDPQDKKWYQTSYANQEGAVAAPTAGLHFSALLRQQILAQGHEFMTLTLHVGPGTFLPVRVDDPLNHQVPSERAFICKEVIQKIFEHKKNGDPVIAIGTTVTRTLETLARRYPSGDFKENVDLTIVPPYRFRLVDHLLSNFHLPQSSLFLLVAAFAGRKNAIHAYQEAISKNYRFYSYGDLTFFQ